MAATTPRKRAPAKKAPVKAPVTDMAKFRDFRDRAKGRFEEADTTPDYVLGPDRGFDPPVVGSWPSDDLEKEIILMDAVRGMDKGTDPYAFLDVLRVFFVINGFNRIIKTFNQFDDRHKLLYGLTHSMLDFYTGKGGGDTPGGTQAS